MRYIEKIKIFLLSDGFRAFALCLIIALLALNFYDRRRAVREINDNLAQFQLSCSMLNTRAQIQIILVGAALEGRKLSPTEVDTITRLWRDAEYDRAFETAGIQ